MLATQHIVFEIALVGVGQVQPANDTLTVGSELESIDAGWLEEHRRAFPGGRLRRSMRIWVEIPATRTVHFVVSEPSHHGYDRPVGHMEAEEETTIEAELLVKVYLRVGSKRR